MPLEHTIKAAMRAKKAQAGTEFPIVIILEILLAFVVGYLFLNLAQAYVGREYVLKQEIANDIGMALEALYGIKGNAYIEFTNLHDFVITISSKTIEVSTKDPVKGVYRLAPVPGSNTLQKTTYEYPPHFALIKNGDTIQASDTISSLNLLACGPATSAGILPLVQQANNIEHEASEEIEKVMQALPASFKQQGSGKSVIIISMVAQDKNPSLVRAYIPYNSKESYYLACMLINSLMGKINADAYYIVPFDVTRVSLQDPRSALKGPGVYLELGNSKSESYRQNPYSAKAAAALITTIEEIQR